MLLHINLLDLLFASLVMWVILITAEGAKRLGWVHGENARKLIHISVGIFLATLPLYMNRREIVAINFSLFAGLLLFSGLWHLFQSIEDVPRWTLGHFLYPLSIIIVTVIFRDQVVYAFAVLELALADGLAAVFGSWRGLKRYRSLGGYKTYFGSLVFFLITLVLVGIFISMRVGISPETILIWLLISSFMTAVEGGFAGGFDNLFVPLVMAALLNAL